MTRFRNTLAVRPAERPRAGQAVGRSRRSGFISLIRIALVVVILFGLLQLVPQSQKVMALKTSGHGRDIQLTTADNPGLNAYSPQELWGGGSPVEDCLACTATQLIGGDKAQSIQSGQAVTPATGDFTTSDTLFSIPEISGSMNVTLTYDAEASAESGAKPGQFGYGWSSSFSPSLSANSGVFTADEENGAEVTFAELGNGGLPAKDGCPDGSYEDYQKYTIANSSIPYCAANRVNAQLGSFPAYGSYEFEAFGGQKEMAFNAWGELVQTGDLADMNAVNYKYDISPGTSNCPSEGETDCIQETDSAGRTTTALQSASGLITNVYDPQGNDYLIGYDGSSDLTSVMNGGFSSSEWQYGYATGATAPYNHEMNAVTTPDNDTTHVTYYSNGMVDTVAAPTGGTTTYSDYEQTTCATTAGCTTGQQQTQVNYPDGEIDVDVYDDTLLTDNLYGPSASGGTGDSSWSFNYDFPPTSDQDADTVETVVPPEGATATIDTDSVGNITSYTDPNGNTTHYMYNDSGGNDLDELCWAAQPGIGIEADASCSNPPYQSTSYTYDSYGDQLSETDADGNTSTSGYYTNGLLCWTAPPTVTGGSSCSNAGTSPSGAPAGSTAYEYDSYGDETMRDVAWNTSVAQLTTNAYNSLGQLTSTTPPDGQGTGDPANYETSYTYWGNGNVATVDAPLGDDTSYTDDLAGNVVNEVDPGGATSTAYDADGRACWTYRSTTKITNPACGSSGNAPSGDTATTYLDDTSAPTSVTDPNGKATTYSYANAAFPTSATAITPPAASSEVTNNAYDLMGNVCVTGPVVVGAYSGSCEETSGDTYDEYDSMGQLQASYDPNGNETQYQYNDDAFPTDPTEITEPGGAVTQDSYDRDGNLLKTVNPDSSVVSYGYDIDDRLCYETPSSVSASCSSPPTGAGSTSFAYDAANDRTQMTDVRLHFSGTAGTLQTTTDTYTYDGEGNLLSDTDDNGNKTSYAYNDAGEVSCIAYPVLASPNCTNAPSSTNSVVDQNYNNDGQLTSTVDWLGNTVSYSGYNPLSELGTITYPSATGESLTYGYDGDGNTTSATYAGPIETGASDSWTPNSDNQVGSWSQLGGFSSTPTHTAYDSYSQVTKATNPGNTSNDSYGIQNNGQLTGDTPPGRSKITFAYNSSQELTTVTNPNTSTTTAYGYTTNGQRCWSGAASASGPCSSPPAGATEYGWDGYGELCTSGASTPGCTSSTETLTAGTTAYTYSGDGLRMSESADSSGGSVTTSTFTWDLVDGGSPPLDIDDGTNAYVYGPLLFGGTAPVEQINLSTKKVTFLASTQSGVQVAFDDSSGTDALDEQAAYSTYGSQTIQSGTSATPFGFQGSYTDASGLEYLINRYYDPTTDQFLSIDPDVAQTGQPYAFTGDDPLNESDPSGLFRSSGNGQLCGGGPNPQCNDTNTGSGGGGGSGSGGGGNGGGDGSTSPTPVIVSTTSGPQSSGLVTVTVTADATIRGHTSGPVITLESDGGVNVSLGGQYGGWSISDEGAIVSFIAILGLSKSSDGSDSVTITRSRQLGPDHIVADVTATATGPGRGSNLSFDYGRAAKTGGVVGLAVLVAKGFATLCSGPEGWLCEVPL